MKFHEAIVKAQHHVDVLSRYHEIGIAPTGLTSDQRPSGIKDPPPRFTEEWRENEHRAAMGKTHLLVRYWKEEAARQEGKAYRSRYSRAKTIKGAEGIDKKTRCGLLAQLDKADEAMVVPIETMKAKLITMTDGYLKKLRRLQTVREDGPNPGPSSVGTGVKPAPTYAQRRSHNKTR